VSGRYVRRGGRADVAVRSWEIRMDECPERAELAPYKGSVHGPACSAEDPDLQFCAGAFDDLLGSS
jgi:hypothetical protein